MQKNVAGQKWIVFAFNRTDNTPQTGDAANITANLRLDGGAANAVDDTNPTELEDGFYVFDITAAESNADLIVIAPASSTSNIQVIGVPGAVWTTAPNFNALGIEADGDLTKVNTLEGHTAQTADHTSAIATIDTEVGVIDGVVDAILLDTAELGAAVGASLSADIAAIKAETADIVADTNELQTDDIPGTLATIVAFLDTEIADILADTAELQTDWANGGRLDLILDAILADTAVIGAAGAGLTAVPWNASWDAEVQSECNDALVALGLDHLISASVTGTDVVDNSIMAQLVSKEATADWDDYVNTTDSLQAIRDRGDSAWTTGAGGTPPQLMQNTTIATLSSQTSFTLTAGSADDDAYNGAVVVVTDQSTSTQKAVGSVLDYTGSSKTITLSADPGIFTMAIGDTIDIIANASSAPTAAQNRAEMDSNSTQLAAIVADTNELQADWANAGRLDAILDAILADTVTLGTPAGSDFSADIAAIKAETALIVADTNELQTDWVNAGRLDTILDSILTDTAQLGAAVGASLSADIAAIKAETALIVADTNELQSDDIPGTLATIAAYLDTEIAAILVDTSTTIPALIATAQADLDIITGADGVNLLTATQASIDAIEADTNELQGDDVPGLIAALNDISTADVNAQVVDVINVDTLVAGQSLAEALRRIGAITSGIISGAGTGTETFLDYASSASSVVVTVDASGNRSGITYN